MSNCHYFVSLQKPKKQYKIFVMNYKTQLYKTAWGEKFAHGVFICFLKEFSVAVGRSGESHKVFVFLYKNRDGNF
jgi:hypothetical protein